MKIHTTLLALLMVASTAFHAARADIILASNTPYAAAQSGQQSDASTAPAYTQAFTTLANSVIDTIDWWGYHGLDSGGAGFDHFVVTLDAVTQTGTLTETDDATGLTHYSFTLSAGTALAAGTLGIINDSPDVEWYWQSTGAVGNPNAADGVQVAYALRGHEALSAIPEPSSPMLLCSGLLILLAFREQVRQARR